MITSMHVEVAENGYVVTVYEAQSPGELYTEPTKYVGQKPADVTRLIGDMLKQEKKNLLGG